MKTTYRITCEYGHKECVTVDEDSHYVRLGGKMCRHVNKGDHLIVKIEVLNDNPRKPWVVIEKKS